MKVISQPSTDEQAQRPGEGMDGDTLGTGVVDTGGHAEITLLPRGQVARVILGATPEAVVMAGLGRLEDVQGDQVQDTRGAHQEDPSIQEEGRLEDVTTVAAETEDTPRQRGRCQMGRNSAGNLPTVVPVAGVQTASSITTRGLTWKDRG